MKSLFAIKTNKYIFRYLHLKLVKYKKNNTKICNIFFIIISKCSLYMYIMNEASFNSQSVLTGWWLYF